MLAQNGTSASNHHVIADQVEALRSAAKRMAGKVAAKAGPPVRSFGTRATEVIKAHPIAAAATAFGLGYLIVRLVRR